MGVLTKEEFRHAMELCTKTKNAIAAIVLFYEANREGIKLIIDTDDDSQADSVPDTERESLANDNSSGSTINAYTVDHFVGVLQRIQLLEKHQEEGEEQSPNWYFWTLTNKNYSFQHISSNSAVALGMEIAGNFLSNCFVHWRYSRMTRRAMQSREELLSFYKLTEFDALEWVEENSDAIAPYLESMEHVLNRFFSGFRDTKEALKELRLLFLDMNYEWALICREHPQFYREFKAEQDAQRQAKEDEAFKRWGLILDRKQKTIRRKGRDELPASIGPKEITLLTDAVQNPDKDSTPQIIEDYRIGGAVSQVGRNIAKNLRDILEPLGLTISKDGKYRLEELT